MSIIEGTVARIDDIESVNDGRWLRVRGDDPVVLERLREQYGIDAIAAASPAGADGESVSVPVTVLERAGEAFRESRVVIVVGERTTVTLEPADARAALDLARVRMERDGREDDSPFEIAASILQAIADTTDGLVSGLNAGIESMMVQSNAILRSLETKKAKDFGISDVTVTQQQLADMEELLSHCMESQLSLAEAARHLRAKRRDHAGRTDLGRLIDDIEGIEHHVEFVHDRVRLLQQTNNLALNVKQNQIIKVFSVVTAVFLPVMLLSTYYSMNFEFMPILGYQFAEPLIIVLSFLFAMLPLIYVRRRGWLR